MNPRQIKHRIVHLLDVVYEVTQVIGQMLDTMETLSDADHIQGARIDLLQRRVDELEHWRENGYT